MSKEYVKRIYPSRDKIYSGYNPSKEYHLAHINKREVKFIGKDRTGRPYKNEVKRGQVIQVDLVLPFSVSNEGIIKEIDNTGFIVYNKRINQNCHIDYYSYLNRNCL